jgi:MFS family permease
MPPTARGDERDALREHLHSAAWGGLSAGIVLLTDVIMAKTLLAPGWQVTLLATLTPAANLVSFYWAGQVQGRPKAGFFLLASVLGRLPLIVLLLRNTAGWMIALNFLYAVASALLITAANAILQVRYSEEARARYFGLATSIGALCTILAVQTAGYVLARDASAFPWLFAAAGVAGLFSAYHLYRMEVGFGRPRRIDSWAGIGWRALRRRLVPPPGPRRTSGLGESFTLARRILRENPGFVRFERNYMIYGFAFMGILPVLPLYVVKDLKMDYQQLSASKGIWSQFGLVVLSPVLGLAMGRLQPLRFTGRMFLLLALYPLCLLVSTFPGVPARIEWVYAALFFFSVAMAGVNISWTLGSMHFAGAEDASAFQGVHVALTGVRGLIAPSLGFLIYSLVGSGPVFLLSALLFAIAGVLMLRQDSSGSGPRATGK